MELSTIYRIFARSTMKSTMDLSIIVPVYNVEKYIHPCIESIFRQGLDDSRFEVIIVNDGSVDKSIEMIADIVQQHDNITVIHQKNQGLSVARNNGIEAAKGDYIQFIDSDDLLIDKTLPFLLDKAISSKVDLVVADFIKIDHEEIVQFTSHPFSQPEGDVHKMSGRELLLNHLNPYYCHVWRALYRRKFLNYYKIRFVPGICFEDIPFTHHCYIKAHRCLRTHWQFIIYRKRHDSITDNFTIKKAMNYCEAIANTWAHSRDKYLDKDVKRKIRDDAFISFSLLFYVLTTSKHISRSEKMMVLKKMKKSVPDLRFKNSFKQRIVDVLFKWTPNTYITLRIFYANYLQNICWSIGDFIRHKKNY